MQSQYMLRKLSLFLLAAAAVTPAAFAQSGFRTGDIRGVYAFYFEGTLIRNPTTSPQPVPVVSVGVMTLDGEGKITKATRYINVGGVVIRETATGTYSVDEEGIGTATFIAIPADGEPPVFPPTREVFQFVVTSGSRGWAASASLRAANGDDIGILAVTRAEFVRQQAP